MDSVLGPLGSQIADEVGSQDAAPLASPASTSFSSSVPNSVFGIYGTEVANQAIAEQEAATAQPRTYQPRSPQPISALDGRVATEAGIPEQFQGPMPMTRHLPRSTMLKLLSAYNNGVNLAGLRDAPLQSAYDMAKAASKAGYHVQFTSGKRDNGTDSYHDHGEAVDARFYKSDGKGGYRDLSPEEEVEVGKRFGKQAGWASMLDEIRYGTTYKTGPHLHFSSGEERGLLGKPIYHGLNPRYWADKGYEDYLDRKTSDAQGKQAEAQGFVLDGPERKGLPKMAEMVASSYGLDPSLFVHQINAESSFNPYAVSSAGASGLAQMMPETLQWLAKRYKFDPNEYAKNPHLQLRAGAMYMHDLLDEFGGNYARALAAYNAGPGTVHKFASGKGNLPEETQNYVFKILKEADPHSVNSVDDAVNMVRGGVGPQLGQEYRADIAKKKIQDAQVDGLGFMDWMTGTGAYAKDNLGTALHNWDEKDPLSFANQGKLFLKEILQDSTFGLSNPAIAALVPGGKDFLKNADNTQQVRDAMLQEGGTFEKIAANYSPTVLRTAAMVASGGMLLKGLRLLPGVGPMLANAGRALTEEEQLLKGVASEGNFLQRMRNLVAGGPYDILMANLAEHAAVGGLGTAAYHLSDYAWNQWKNNEHVDPRELVSRGITASLFGGALGTSLGLAIPASLGLTGSFLSRIVGTPEVNGAAGAVLNKLDSMNWLQKGVASGLLAAGVGGTAAAFSDVTGISKVVFGDDLTASSGLKAGATAGVAMGLLRSGMNYAGVSEALSKSPAFMSMLDHVRGIVQYVPDKMLGLMAGNLLDEAQAHKQFAVESGADGAYKIAKAQLDLSRESGQELVTNLERQEQLAMQQFSASANNLKAVEANMKQIEGDSPQAVKLYRELQQAKEAWATANQPGTDPQLARGFEQAYKAAEKAVAEARKASKDLTDNAEGFSPEWAPYIKSVPERSFSVAYDRYANLDLNRTRLSQELAQMHAQTADVLKVNREIKDTAKQVLGGAWMDLDGQLQKQNQITKETGSYDIGAPIFENPLGLKDGTPEYEAAFNQFHADMVQQGLKHALRGGEGGASFIDQALKNTILDATRGKLGQDPKDLTSVAIENAKKQVELIESQLKDTTLPDISTFAGEMQTYNKRSPVRWNNSDAGEVLGGTAPIKGAKLALVRADLVHQMALDAGMDPAAIDALAETYGKKFATSVPGVRPMMWDGKPTIESAAMARVVMQNGVERVPFLRDMATDTEMRTNLKAAKDGMMRNQLEAIKESIGITESVNNKWLQDAIVATLNHDGPAGMVDRNQDNPMVQGANITALSDPRELLKDLQNRLKSLSADIKENRSGLLSESAIPVMDNLVEAGINPTTEAARVFMAKQGIGADEATKLMKDFQNAFSVAEIHRIKEFNSMISGRAPISIDPNNPPPPGATINPQFVTSRLREKFAAQIPATENKDLKGAMQLLLGQHFDSIAPSVMRQYRVLDKVIAEAAGRMGKDYLGDAVGTLFTTYRTVLHDVPISMRKFHADVIEPLQAKLLKPLTENFKELRTSDGLKEFHGEMLKALENPTKMEQFRKKYGDHADPYLELTYGYHELDNQIRMYDPESTKLMHSMFSIHRFQRAAGHLAATGDTTTYNAKLSKITRLVEKYRSMEGIERAVTAAEGDLRTRLRPSLSPDEFAKLTEEQQVEELFGKDARRTMSDEEYKKNREAANDLGNTMLLKDPITDPIQLMHLQLAARIKGIGMRKLIRGMYDMKFDNNGKVERMIEHESKGKYGSSQVTYKNHKGEMETANRITLDVMAPRFGEMSWDLGNGETVSSHELRVHPGLKSAFFDYIGPDRPGQRTNFDKFMHLARNAYLMGGIVPFMRNMVNSLGMDMISTPMRSWGVTAAGAKMLAAEATPGAAAVSASRAGLNLRGIETNTMEMARTLVDDFGPVVANKVLGVGDSKVGAFLTAADPGHPGREIARQSLSPFWRTASDIFAAPMAADQAVNHHAIFKLIEAGQLAGHNMRVTEFLNHPDVKMIPDPEMRLFAAQQAAADVTNRVAGAMPSIWAGSKLRNAVFKYGMTPQWFMSKAYTIVDALDAATSLANQKFSKGASDKGIMEFLANRRPFAQYPPEMRNAIRQRLVYSVGGQLMAGVAALNAMQFVANQTFTFQHPPDKWMHLYYNGNYYNNFVTGQYVRELFKGMEDMHLGGILQEGWKDGPGGALSAAGDSVRNAFPALARLANSELFVNPEMLLDFYNNHITTQQKGAPLSASLMDYMDYMQQKQLPSVSEFLSMGDHASLTEMIGLRGALGVDEGGTSEDRQSRMLTSRQHILRQAGVWESLANVPRSKLGEIKEAQNESKTAAMARVADHLKRSVNAVGEDKMKAVSGAYSAWMQGVKVQDKRLKGLYPNGVYRLSPQAFRGLLMQYTNPTFAALQTSDVRAKAALLQELQGTKMDEPAFDLFSGGGGGSADAPEDQ